MIEVTQLRAGTVFEENGKAWVVLKYEHVKMGRGSATIKVKARDLRGGATIEKSFINGARVQDVILSKRQGQYLYHDENGYAFMDPATYEQFSVADELVGDQGKFLKEGTQVDLKFYGDEAMSIVLPLKMIFTVTETDPGFKGNTVTNVYKDATIDTGATIKVPMFIEIGEKITVNTDTGEYVERAK
jgi:elongation factor P